MTEVNELKLYGINATETTNGNKEMLSLWFDNCVLHIKKDAIVFSPVWKIRGGEHYEEDMKKFKDDGL